MPLMSSSIHSVQPRKEVMHLKIPLAQRSANPCGLTGHRPVGIEDFSMEKGEKSGQQ